MVYSPMAPMDDFSVLGKRLFPQSTSSSSSTIQETLAKLVQLLHANEPTATSTSSSSSPSSSLTSGQSDVLQALGLASRPSLFDLSDLIKATQCRSTTPVLHHPSGASARLDQLEQSDFLHELAKALRSTEQQQQQQQQDLIKSLLAAQQSPREASSILGHAFFSPPKKLQVSMDLKPEPVILECPPANRRVKGNLYFIKNCIKRWDGKRFAKCCEVQTCTKLAQGPTSYCKSHGGGTRCKVTSCTRAAKGGANYCQDHCEDLPNSSPLVRKRSRESEHSETGQREQQLADADQEQQPTDVFGIVPLPLKPDVEDVDEDYNNNNSHSKSRRLF